MKSDFGRSSFFLTKPSVFEYKCYICKTNQNILHYEKDVVTGIDVTVMPSRYGFDPT